MASPRSTHETHSLLRTQPGFVQDRILEQAEGEEATRIATMVEWTDDGSMRAAGDAVRRMRRESGFDPQTFMTQRGISADMRVYRARQLDPAG